MRLPPVFKQALYAYPIPLLFGVISLFKGDLWRAEMFGLTGYGWSLLLLSLPWTIGRIVVLNTTGGIVENAQQRRVARRVALAYIPVALLCVAAIAWAMGLESPQQAKDFLLLMFFPFSLPGLL